MSVSLSTIVRRGEEHVETRAGEQIMMMSVAQGNYYVLGGTAERIWEMIEKGPVAIETIVNRLLDEFDVDRDTCEEQVLSFVRSLLDDGLAVEHRHAADP